jgi:hypothetical protein
MALEKKPLVSKTTSISAAPQKKRSVTAKVDTAKPAATKVVAAMRPPY